MTGHQGVPVGFAWRRQRRTLPENVGVRSVVLRQHDQLIIDLLDAIDSPNGLLSELFVVVTSHLAKDADRAVVVLDSDVAQTRMSVAVKDFENFGCIGACDGRHGGFQAGGRAR